MERVVSRVVEELELLEGDKWDPQLDSLPKKLSARKVLPAGKSIRVHLGKGLNHGHVEGGSYTTLSCRSALYFRLRNRTIELTGPLTVRELLQAIGDAQLFECLRNAILSSWLGRHLKGHWDDPDDEKRPVDCIPLNPEFVKRFEGTKTVWCIRGVNETHTLPPDSILELDAPADVDPTAGMDLQALMDLMGGEEKALDYSLGGGSTYFHGLKAAAGGCEEWRAVWGSPFA